MVEAFEKVVMYICLAGMAGLILLVFGVWLHGRSGHIVQKCLTQFSRLPLATKIVVALFVLNLIVFGSTKPTNNAPSSASSPTTLDLQDEPSIFSLTELSDTQLAVGAALAEVRTTETHDFTMPANAVMHRPWQLRGASEDVFPLTFTNWCFRLGTNVYDFI